MKVGKSGKGCEIMLDYKARKVAKSENLTMRKKEGCEALKVAKAGKLRIRATSNIPIVLSFLLFCLNFSNNFQLT